MAVPWMILLGSSGGWSGESPLERGIVQPSSPASSGLSKAMSAFAKEASEIDRIGAVRDVLPAIVDSGRTLLWVLDTSAVCCSDRSQVWVLARDLATGRDGRRWRIVDRGESGENLLEPRRARSDLGQLVRMLSDSRARSLGGWRFGTSVEMDRFEVSGKGFKIEVGRGTTLAFPVPGELEVRRGARVVSKRKMVGLGTCPSPDGEAMVRCPMPLRWMAGWSDSACRVAVVRMESHEGCDGCEPRPLDLVLPLP